MQINRCEGCGRELDLNLKPPIVSDKGEWHEECLAKKQEDDKVKCTCGNKLFFVTFGDYECIGECSSCGNIRILYDG